MEECVPAQDKPKHLSREYAEQFKENSVVAAYAHRPPIPPQVFDVLADLIVDEPRIILDAGCGTGAVARQLAPLVERVDAVDFSLPMVEEGRRLPEGNRANLRWIVGNIEDASLDPPYALIVAAGSLHWMDWSVVMPRFREMLTTHGTLAVVWQTEGRQSWTDRLVQLIQQFSTNQSRQRFNLIGQLSARGLFRQRGECQTDAMPFSQSIYSYIESIHSRDGFSRERMTPQAAAAFDTAVRQLLIDACPDGMVHLAITGHIVWGDPAPLPTRGEAHKGGKRDEQVDDGIGEDGRICRRSG